MWKQRQLLDLLRLNNIASFILGILLKMTYRESSISLRLDSQSRCAFSSKSSSQPRAWMSFRTMRSIPPPQKSSFPHEAEEKSPAGSRLISTLLHPFETILGMFAAGYTVSEVPKMSSRSLSGRSACVLDWNSEGRGRP